MLFLTVPPPVGHLIATGQRTLILSDSPLQVASDILIRTALGVPQHREPGDLAAALWLQMEADGADLGSTLTDGYNRGGTLTALVFARSRGRMSGLEAADLLRASSLSITTRTAAHIEQVYRPRYPVYGTSLSNIRPLPANDRLFHWEHPNADLGVLPTLRAFQSHSLWHHANEQAGTALVLGDPTVET
jgi:hypothetical protein